MFFIFSKKSYHPIPWRDAISRPLSPQAVLIPLDHADAFLCFLKRLPPDILAGFDPTTPQAETMPPDHTAFYGGFRMLSIASTVSPALEDKHEQADVVEI
jgi:hypothetical protein